jgi:hypothetical protein
MASTCRSFLLSSVRYRAEPMDHPPWASINRCRVAITVRSGFP